MTNRSHWVSIAVFFACGVIAGIAGLMVAGNHRQRELIGGWREAHAAIG